MRQDEHLQNILTTISFESNSTGGKIAKPRDEAERLLKNPRCKLRQSNLIMLLFARLGAATQAVNGNSQLVCLCQLKGQAGHASS